MALIHCKECNREISDKAATCPGCGAPVAAPAPAPRPQQPPMSSYHRPTHKPAAASRPPAARVMRTGAKFEGIGFVMILAAMAAPFVTGGLGVSAVLGGIGFAVFLVGRFQ